MKLNTKTWLLSSIAILGVLLLIWLIQYRPWEKEVSISTTKEAFTGPNVGTELLKKRDGKTILQIAITPAPWPKEAKTIWQAAEAGKIVHVLVLMEKSQLRFDITGISLSGHLQIECQSEQEARKIVEALELTRDKA